MGGGSGKHSLPKAAAAALHQERLKSTGFADHSPVNGPSGACEADYAIASGTGTGTGTGQISVTKAAALPVPETIRGRARPSLCWTGQAADASRRAAQTTVSTVRGGLTVPVRVITHRSS